MSERDQIWDRPKDDDEKSVGKRTSKQIYDREKACVMNRLFNIRLNLSHEARSLLADKLMTGPLKNYGQIMFLTDETVEKLIAKVEGPPSAVANKDDPAVLKEADHDVHQGRKSSELIGEEKLFIANRQSAREAAAKKKIELEKDTLIAEQTADLLPEERLRNYYRQQREE